MTKWAITRHIAVSIGITLYMAMILPFACLAIWVTALVDEWRD